MEILCYIIEKAYYLNITDIYIYMLKYQYTYCVLINCLKFWDEA